jgi:hypothetical protein
MFYMDFWHSVAECKTASYQGVSGIMIRDTAETFGIISEDNRFRGTLFLFADFHQCKIQINH